MRTVILLLNIFLSAAAFAETSLWKVSKGSHELYLGGSVHILSQRDLPFPAAFDQAFDDAQLIAFETDMGKLQEPGLQIKMMSMMSYQDGRLLNQLISPELYAELNAYLTQRGLVPHMFLTMKPSGVMLTMLGVELQRLGITEAGADFHYYQKAVKAGKPTEGLEIIDRHLEYLADIGEGNEEAFLKQTLKDTLKIEEMMQKIVSAWKTGDLKSIETLFVEDMRTQLPQVYETLLVTRNLNWMAKIRNYLETPEKEFVIVGVAHMVGPDGLLRFLENEGYQVEQL